MKQLLGKHAKSPKLIIPDFVICLIFQMAAQVLNKMVNYKKVFSVSMK